MSLGDGISRDLQIHFHAINIISYVCVVNPVENEYRYLPLRHTPLYNFLELSEKIASTIRLLSP